MIEAIVTDIAQKVQATLPFVTATKYIARQDPTGIITLERPEEWLGVDDAKAGRLYFRFRDGWDAMFTPGTLISAPNVEETVRLRAVFMHYCTNEQEIARFLAYAILEARNHSIRYSVRLRMKSTDKQFIFAAETKREGATANELRLVMIDFDVTYKDAITTTGACLPECDVC